MFINLFLVIYLVLISIEDTKSLKIKNSVLLGMFLTCFCSSVPDFSESIFFNLLNSILFFCLFYFVSKFTKGLGSGDIKLIFIIAFFEGFFKTILCLLIASMCGILFSVVIHLKNRDISKIPFAPFITLGFAAEELSFGLVL